MKVAGHPGLSVSIFDEAQWQEQLSKTICAEPKCLSWAEAGPEDSITSLHTRGKLIPGRVWYRNGYSDSAFSEKYRKYCFTCAFWNEKLDTADEGTVIIATETGMIESFQFDAEHPWVEKQNGEFLGFGGRRFTIQFNPVPVVGGEPIPGIVVATNNLWSQGPIPEWFYDRFHENAKFIM